MNTATKETNYRFYVEPLTPNANEQIAASLNALGDAAFTSETQKIIVNGKDVLGVYLLPHKMLTKISRSEHHTHVRYYVQEGEGETRPYKHIVQKLRKVGQSKVVKSANKALRMLTGK